MLQLNILLADDTYLEELMLCRPPERTMFFLLFLWKVAASYKGLLSPPESDCNSAGSVNCTNCVDLQR